MNWINIRTETLRSPAFVGANPGAIETWLKVLAYCCEQENDGCIIGAARWTDRQWLTTCGVSKAEIENASGLIYDDAVAVFVEGFPSEKQAEIKAKRTAASKGGRSSGETRRRSTTSTIPRSTASPDGRTEGEGEGEGEGKKNGNGNHPEEPPSPRPASPSGVREGKSSDMLPTTEQSKRFATIFHRKLSTPWSSGEVSAYKRLGTIPEEDLAAVEAYYAAGWPPRRDVNILRHDLITFLNNFPGEVDRAHSMKTKAKPSMKNEWLPTSSVVPLPDPAEQERIRAAALAEAARFKRQQGGVV